ncbi:MAG TPA: secondary thiamine-phosphate synthase enzyme YjbQ [Terricaulis sp.]|nr:secondary thiamine-phosphate synthase enzyme YjbQ [Terricaulis sp.]
MRQAFHTLSITTRGKGLYEFTREAKAWIARERFGDGLLSCFCRHTSASLLINENADPDVRTDLAAYFERIAPESGPYVHDAEGPDDMPAHIRAALTQSHLSIPVQEGAPLLGAWQGLYLFEHRRAAHTREIVLHFIGG